MKNRKLTVLLALSLTLFVGLAQVQTVSAASNTITITIKRIGLADDGDGPLRGKGDIYYKADSSNLGSVGSFEDGVEYFYGSPIGGPGLKYDTIDKTYTRTYSSSIDIRLYMYDADWPDADDKLLEIVITASGSGEPGSWLGWTSLDYDAISYPGLVFPGVSVSTEYTKSERICNLFRCVTQWNAFELSIVVEPTPDPDPIPEPPPPCDPKYLICP